MTPILKTQSRIPILLLKQSTLWVQWAKSFPHVILDAPVRTQWLRRPKGRTVSQSKVEASKSSASLAKSFVDKRVVTKSLWVKHLNEVCSQKGFKSYYCIFAVCKIPKTDDIRIYDIRNQRRESLRYRDCHAPSGHLGRSGRTLHPGACFPRIPGN